MLKRPARKNYPFIMPSPRLKSKNSMPKHKVHKYVDRIMLGHALPEVHHAIDLPYVVLGRKHRRLFHTPLEAMYMGMIATSDPRGAQSGWLHTWVDQKCSEDKEFKHMLEMMAKNNEEWSKHNKKMRRMIKKLQSEGKRKSRRR
jgi:hypothetical protein